MYNPSVEPLDSRLVPADTVHAATGRLGGPTESVRADTGRMSGFLGVMLLIVGVRVLVLGIGLLSVHNAPEGAVPQFNLEHPWVAWDARQYYEIALHGYAPDRAGQPYRGDGNTFNLIAYFPMIPLMGRALSAIMPLDVALVLLSNVCSIIGFGFLYDWARRMSSPRAAAICVLILATFPGAVSFSAGMTEGPFFMLVAIAFWLLQRESFYGAAIVAGIATAVRPTGVALAMIVPLYAWMRQGGLPLRRRLAIFVALGAISFSGLISYEAFLWQRYKSPTAYSDAQKSWTRQDQQRMQQSSAHGVTRYSWEFFKARLTRPQAWNHVLALAILLVTAAGFIKPMGIPRVLLLIPLMIFLMTALPGRGLRISSIPRYESAAVPLFLLVALWLCARRRVPLVVMLLLLQFAIQAYYAILFPREMWVG